MSELREAEPAALPLIPTRLKYRLAQSLSWPVGAEAISRGLAGSPFYEKLELWFSDSPVWRRTLFQQMLRESAPYPIVTFTYKPPTRLRYSGSARMQERGDFEARWEIRVCPVLRERRHEASTLLLREGLPAAVAWMESFAKRVGWERSVHTLELRFEPGNEELDVASRERSRWRE